MLNTSSLHKTFKSLGYTHTEQMDPSGITVFFLKDRFGISTSVAYARKYNELWMRCTIYQSDHL